MIRRLRLRVHAWFAALDDFERADGLRVIVVCNIAFVIQVVASVFAPRLACRWFDYHSWANDHCRICGRNVWERADD